MADRYHYGYYKKEEYPGNALLYSVELEGPYKNPFNREYKILKLSLVCGWDYVEDGIHTSKEGWLDSSEFVDDVQSEEFVVSADESPEQVLEDNGFVETTRPHRIYKYDEMKDLHIPIKEGFSNKSIEEEAETIYSVSYKSNGVYQSIGVKAISENDAIEKVKDHFAKDNKKAEIIGVDRSESEETMKKKGKPILENRYFNEDMSVCEYLNKIDHKCIDENLHFYDLRSLFEAVAPKLTAQDKNEIKKVLQTTDDPDTIAAVLQSKIKNEELDIDEASYGGAYDIADDQYFTKEEIVEFGNEVADTLSSIGYDKYYLSDVYVEGNKLQLTISATDDGIEESSIVPLDMRRIRKSQDLNKFHKVVVDELIRKFKEDGLQFDHPQMEVYPLGESIDVSEYEELENTISDDGKQYKVYRKSENGKAKYVAQEISNKGNIGNPFEITYRQFRGFDGINNAGKLGRYLGKKLLPMRESQSELWDSSRVIDITEYCLFKGYDIDKTVRVVIGQMRKEGSTLPKDLNKLRSLVYELYDELPLYDESGYPIYEDTVKQGNKWVNKGKEGTHGTFRTKKAADAQRKAMFANGYKESLNENSDKYFTVELYSSHYDEPDRCRFNDYESAMCYAKQMTYDYDEIIITEPTKNGPSVVNSYSKQDGGWYKDDVNESFDNPDDHIYDDHFRIERNEVGNYCAYHKKEYLNKRRELQSGEEYTDPYCWSNRKRYLEDVLDDIVMYYPDELNNSILSKDVAQFYKVDTYAEQESKEENLNEEYEELLQSTSELNDFLDLPIEKIDKKLLDKCYEKFLNDLRRVPTWDAGYEWDRYRKKFYTMYKPFVDKCKELNNSLHPTGYGRYDYFNILKKEICKEVVYVFPYGWKMY